MAKSFEQTTKAYHKILKDCLRHGKSFREIGDIVGRSQQAVWKNILRNKLQPSEQSCAICNSEKDLYVYGEKLFCKKHFNMMTEWKDLESEKR